MLFLRHLKASVKIGSNLEDTTMKNLSDSTLSFSGMNLSSSQHSVISNMLLQFSDRSRLINFINVLKTAKTLQRSISKQKMSVTMLYLAKNSKQKYIV